MDLREAVRDSFVPARSWAAWRRRMVQAVLVAAVLFTILAGVGNDVPWLLSGLLVIVSVVYAVATAWRTARAAPSSTVDAGCGDRG